MSKKKTTKQQVQTVNITDVFKDNFISYGQEVIKNRALPDIRDGLKPVQRASLYEYFVSGATSKKANVKMARLSGAIIGKWHPHGDCLCYDTKVLLQTGEFVKIGELYERTLRGGTSFPIYAVDRNNNIVPADMTHVRIGQYAKKEYVIHLSDGNTLRVTGNHPVRLLTNEYRSAEDLQVGDILSTYNHTIDTGGVGNIRTLNSPGCATTNLFELAKQQYDELRSEPGHVVHHIDGNRKNNTRENLIRVTREEHALIHKAYFSGLSHGRDNMFAEDGVYRKSTREKNKRIANIYSENQVFLRARKIVLEMLDNNIELTNENYEKLRSSGKYYNYPLLSTLIRKGYITCDISEFDHTQEVDYSFACGLNGTKSIVSESKCGNPEHGSRLAYQTLLTRFTYVLRVAGVANVAEITEAIYEKTHASLYDESTRKQMPRYTKERLSDMLSEHLIIEKIDIVDVDDKPMYDFTVKDYENALFYSSDGKLINLHNSAVEEALVNMSQEWKNNVPLVSIKGNNGSVYGDPAAAGRYIESRTTPAGDTLGTLLSPDIVPFGYNYDDSEQMPTIMPAQLPVLLLNGATGIAVGLACSIPTHNPSQVMDTVITYLKKPKSSTEELLDVLEGPDFPTGGEIINKDELLTAYHTGKGRIRVRGKVAYNKKEHALHIIEVPYTRSGSVENLIADITLASIETKDKKGKVVPPKIQGIAKVENHSGKDGIDIKVSLKVGVSPTELENQLFALTPLEDTMPFDFRALNDKDIKRYTLKSYLCEYVRFQQELLIAKYTKEKNIIQNRIEILSGRIILQQVIDEVVACAKLANGRSHLETVLTTGTKPENLPKKYHKTVGAFRFTEVQAKDIASLPIYRISKLDIQEIIAEGEKLRKELAHTESMLQSDIKRRNEIIKNHEALKKLYPESRKTNIANKPFATASKVEIKETSLYVALDNYNYLRIEEKPFEGATETTNKSRLGVFDADGVLWNLHLENVKPTTGRGTLINQLLPGVDPVGWVTLPTNNEGLFLYDNGNAKRVDMDNFMTKTKATKVASGKVKDGVKLVQYATIPKGSTTITVNGRAVNLDKISKQGISGGGVKGFAPSEVYTVEFDTVEISTNEQPTPPEQKNAWCVFHKDGTLTFDWDVTNPKPEGLYVVDYNTLLQQTLVFVHTDGTAKQVDGSQFEVKTKRTSIKANKDGCEILYLAPTTETLLATFDTNTQKRISVSNISKQGKTGGGVRAFYHPKHKLVSVTDGVGSDIELVSLATQPKPIS